MLTQPVLLAAGAISALGVGAAVAQSCKLSKGPERRNWNGVVFGHRGCRFVPGVVENTMAAYEYALDLGADGIEFDVRLCGTDELVVFHDAYTTPQAHGPKRLVRDMPFAEVQNLSYVADPSGFVRPPLVEEVIELCIRRNCKMLFELKHYSWGPDVHKAVSATLALARRYHEFFQTRCTIISFNPLALYLIRRADPTLAVGPLYDDKTITGVAMGGCDAAGSTWLRLFNPKLLDRLFASCVDTWASSIMGASMTCTRVDLCDRAKAVKHSEQGRLVYLYGLGEAMPPSLRDVKATVACDDAHGVLKASIL